jgi:ParB-like chromosome segregation protein Spo0J
MNNIKENKNINQENQGEEEQQLLKKPNGFSTIKINPEYSKLLNPLSNLDYEAMKNSIKEDGLHYSIIVNSKGEILDGHHRYKIWKELEIILPIKYEIKYFEDPLKEKRFVIDSNLKRRQLNDFEKAELAYKREDIYKEQARIRQLSKLNNVKDKLPLGSSDHNDQEKGRVIEVISKRQGLSPKTYQRAKTIIENGEEETKEKLRQGKSTISKEYKKIQRDRKKLDLLSEINLSDNNNENDQSKNYKLIYGNFIEQSQKEIQDNSIDLIFTDPPYGVEYLPLYQELAKLAIRVLKPGGSLITYAGRIILADIFKIFDGFSLCDDTSNYLKFWWEFTVVHSGHHSKVHQRNIFPGSKPLLWYVKGERPNTLVISNTISDTIQSNPPSKFHHEWEQSPVESEYIVKNLTIENQTVLDPIMDSGTTGIAALNLNRRFIRIEIDKKHFEIGKNRIVYDIILISSITIYVFLN